MFVFVMFCICLLYLLSLLCHSNFLFLYFHLIFKPLLTVEYWSKTIIVDLCISIFCQILPHIFWWSFNRYINVYNFFCCIEPIINIWYASLYVIKFFWLKVYFFSDISIATIALSWLLFAWNNFFLPFNLFCIFWCKVSLL